MAKKIRLPNANLDKASDKKLPIIKFAQIIGIVGLVLSAIGIIISYNSKDGITQTNYVGEVTVDNSQTVNNDIKNTIVTDRKVITKIYSDFLKDYFPLPNLHYSKRIIEDLGIPDKIIKESDMPSNLEFFNIVTNPSDDKDVYHYQFVNGEVYFVLEIIEAKQFISGIVLTVKEDTYVEVPQIFIHGYYGYDEGKKIFLGKSSFKEIMSLGHIKEAGVDIIESNNGSISRLGCESGINFDLTNYMKDNAYNFSFTLDGLFYHLDLDKEAYSEFIKEIPRTLSIY